MASLCKVYRKCAKLDLMLKSIIIPLVAHSSKVCIGLSADGDNLLLNGWLYRE